MIRTKIRKLAEITNGRLIKSSGKNHLIKNITTNSNEVLPNSVFVALNGEKFDGHDFILPAIENGALAIIASNNEKVPDVDVDVILVENTLSAYQSIAANKRFEKDYIVVGITGSVGKTSTRHLIDCAINDLIKTHSTKKNFNNEIGLPKTILEVGEGVEVCILEMGMRGLGEISVLTNIAKPDIAVITNIGLAHIERLKTKDNIFKAKSEILEGLTQDGLLVANADDEKLRKLVSESFGKHRSIAVTTKPYLDLKSDLILCAQNIRKSYLGISFDVLVTPYGGKNHVIKDISLNTYGEHHITNAMIAISIAIELDLNIDLVCQNLKKYESVDNRENITTLDDFILIDDTYNSSPESCEASLKMLSGYKGKRKIAVLAGMLELGDYTISEHILVGKKCVEHQIDVVVTLGELGNLISEGIGIESGDNNTKTINFTDKNEIYLYLRKILKEGDTILVKGSRRFAMEDVVKSIINDYTNGDNNDIRGEN